MQSIVNCVVLFFRTSVHKGHDLIETEGKRGKLHATRIYFFFAFSDCSLSIIVVFKMANGGHADKNKIRAMRNKNSSSFSGTRSK